jgi:hypothetical protein
MGTFESVVNASTIIIIFAIPFALFAYVRYLRHKEIIALAERGLLPPERRRRNRDTLLWGVIITMIGLGLLCGLWPLSFIDNGPVAVGGVSESGEVASDGSIAVEGVSDSGQVAIDESEGSDLIFGIGPWMVVGLLPIFFGLALLLIYFINRREGVEEGDYGPGPSQKSVDSDER